jgi:hypothetical protein
MSYLPASCERCPSIALVHADECVDGRAPCGSCGGIVSVLPGCAFPERDLALFTSLCEVVCSSTLSQVDAQRLAAAISDSAISGMQQQALNNLAHSIPPLRPLQEILNEHPLQRRRAISMLETILRGLGRRRDSGVLSTERLHADQDGSRSAADDEHDASASAHVGPIRSIANATFSAANPSK